MSDEENGSVGLPDSSKITPEDIDNSPSELPSIVGSGRSQEQSYKESFLEVTEENVYLKEQSGKLRLRIKEMESTAKTNDLLDSLIVPRADKIFWFMCSYCVAVGFLLAAASFGKGLTEGVLKVLVGSTSIAVVGLVGTIVAGIFAGARRH